MEFILGMLFAKIFLGSSIDNKRISDDSISLSLLKPTDQKYYPTNAEIKERQKSLKKQHREFRQTVIFVTPLLFCLSSVFGGLSLTTATCGTNKLCAKNNLESNIIKFGQHHIQAIHQPINQSKLVDLPFLPRYWIGVGCSYVYLFLLSLVVLTFAFDFLFFFGGQVWRWASMNNNN